MAELMNPVNLPTPPPVGGVTPANLGPLPGVKPYYDVIVNSFLRTATQEQLLDDEWFERISRRALQLATKIITNFTANRNLVEMPAPKLPGG